MQRRWRVRQSYPEPVVELVACMLAEHDVPAVARLLDIPASVIYRWRALRRLERDAMHGSAPAIAALAARCDALGFDYGRRLGALDSKAPPVEPLAAPQDPAPASPRSARRSRTQGAMKDGDRRAAKRYVFDARRERPGVGVRRRLEAAKRLIDAQYFLDLDSRMLAEAAQMSRHHFIRMFSGFYGVSPHRYLTRARIGAAKRLLQSSREPIEVIAVGVGFRSGTSLTRAFKQVEGASASKICRIAARGASERAGTPAGHATGAPAE